MHPTLSSLGERICIIGPSCSGKSTLCKTLGAHLGYPHLHLDQIAHLENTNWVRRDNDAFIALHDDFIAQDQWIIEGNYSITMPQRFQRATSIIWLNPSRLSFFRHYIRRTLFEDQGTRAGHLSGAVDKFNLSLIKHTLIRYPKNCQKYKDFIQGAGHKALKIKSMKELNSYYKKWGLQSPV